MGNTRPCPIARSARCGSRLRAAYFVVVRERKTCTLTPPQHGGARSAGRSTPDWLPDWFGQSFRTGLVSRSSRSSPTAGTTGRSVSVESSWCGCRLAAVIDFGCSGVGDPACDLAIAWTFLSGQSREAFRVALPLDAATWARGRGWALWKALITFAGNLQADQAAAAKARRVIDEVLDEHVHAV